MVNIVELDKRIMLYSAWTIGTGYKTILTMNPNTARQIAFILGVNDINGNYKNCKVYIDEDLKDEITIISSEKEVKE